MRHNSLIESLLSGVDIVKGSVRTVLKLRLAFGFLYTSKQLLCSALVGSLGLLFPETILNTAR